MVGCGNNCETCVEDTNELMLLGGLFTDNNVPVLQPAELDPFGNTNTVYRNENGYLRFGSIRHNNML